MSTIIPVRARGHAPTPDPRSSPGQAPFPQSAFANRLRPKADFGGQERLRRIGGGEKAPVTLGTGTRGAGCAAYRRSVKPVFFRPPSGAFVPRRCHKCRIPFELFGLKRS